MVDALAFGLKPDSVAEFITRSDRSTVLSATPVVVIPSPDIGGANLKVSIVALPIVSREIDDPFETLYIISIGEMH